jgi:hypothetical protein
MAYLDQENICGSGACKNVGVTISQRSGDPAFWVVFRLDSEFLPAEFEFALDYLEYLDAILGFLDSHIGSDQDGSYTCAATNSSRIRVAKDADTLDRFSFFFGASGVCVMQVFDGLSSASLIRALAAALGELRAGNQSANKPWDATGDNVPS